MLEYRVSLYVRVAVVFAGSVAGEDDDEMQLLMSGFGEHLSTIGGGGAGGLSDIVMQAVQVDHLAAQEYSALSMAGEGVSADNVIAELDKGYIEAGCVRASELCDDDRPSWVAG